jgi:hypothetical protein
VGRGRRHGLQEQLLCVLLVCLACCGCAVLCSSPQLVYDVVLSVALIIGLAYYGAYWALAVQLEVSPAQPTEAPCQRCAMVIWPPASWLHGHIIAPPCTVERIKTRGALFSAAQAVLPLEPCRPQVGHNCLARVAPAETQCPGRQCPGLLWSPRLHCAC